ncbi:MAG: hypothetical protein P4L53_03700 [Candidatus Obscuribacterales bacterium]|nr:hypothetical protein [Candidatus Obscuribacterales bacterium]
MDFSILLYMVVTSISAILAPLWWLRLLTNEGEEDGLIALRTAKEAATAIGLGFFSVMTILIFSVQHVESRLILMMVLLTFLMSPVPLAFLKQNRKADGSPTPEITSAK